MQWSDSNYDAHEPSDAYGGYSDYEAHSGDTYQDQDYSESHHQYSQPDYIIPANLKDFLVYFHKVITDQDLYEIQNAYENGFNKLTDRYFRNTPWPETAAVSNIVNDELFLTLYRELYYRHLYARVPTKTTLQHRIDSYFNYCSLFNYILNDNEPVPLDLPNQWLWDIIDEFIYQFQSFTIYRSAIEQRTPQEKSALQRNPKVWNVHSVLNALHSLVEKSNINRQLEVYTSGDSHFQNKYSCVPACQITTFYYVGFAYMMMRRYQDAIRTFSNILLYIQRTEQMFQYKVQLYDQINKMNDKMYMLLAICLVLHPMRIDESVHFRLREKCGDSMLKMQMGSINDFEQCFSRACPKFLSPVTPDYEKENMNFSKYPYELQQKVFLREVEQQFNSLNIRSFLKLYTTLPIPKLAAMIDISEHELHTQLMCFKHKMKNLVWTKGTSGLDGEFQSTSELDFYINRDMIHVADTKVANRYGDYFIRQIHRFQEVIDTMKYISNSTF
ncbi:eukaryotic translation initiation factor 3 subunit L-like [Octopus bimaculoides]|uniref:eukaryotic translation initiation factor 3 subunit L-like n=1 Tax=Octopus bimaculoides TaxID=37653 RepID=UPI0022E5EA4C|nr:eukaryotic translation initiation factor 3 subunit L-like [Octopus bimaculoides]